MLFNSFMIKAEFCKIFAQKLLKQKLCKTLCNHQRTLSNFGHSDVEIWQPCFRYLLTTELTIITVFRLDYIFMYFHYHNCILIIFANLLILLQVATEIYMPRPPNLASCFELKTFSVWGRRWPSSWPWDGVIRKIKNITSIFCHAAFASTSTTYTIRAIQLDTGSSPFSWSSILKLSLSISLEPMNLTRFPTMIFPYSLYRYAWF